MNQQNENFQSKTMRKPREFIFPAVAAFLIVVFCCSSILAQTPQQPAARVENVTDDYYGVKVTDPYRWLEDLKAKETQDWIKVQADYTDAYLGKLPVRDQILETPDGSFERERAGSKHNAARQSVFFLTSRAG